MTFDASSESSPIALEARVRAGDELALAELFDRHRDRLKRMIKLRLDRRLQGRVDASDVLQEAYLDLSQRLPEFSREAKYPVFLWMRLVAGQRLGQVHRKHLGAAMRNAELEVSLYQRALPQASTEFLASRLLGHFTSVSQHVLRAEQQIKLQELLNSMDEIDREILALRHFEELSNDEAAQVLEIQPGTASKRYIRALRRLKETMQSIPGMLDK
jgi:RNA polymerase sigma-70 factor (ECF subfamily)